METISVCFPSHFWKPWSQTWPSLLFSGNKIGLSIETCATFPYPWLINLMGFRFWKFWCLLLSLKGSDQWMDDCIPLNFHNLISKSKNAHNTYLHACLYNIHNSIFLLYFSPSEVCYLLLLISNSHCLTNKLLQTHGFTKSLRWLSKINKSILEIRCQLLIAVTIVRLYWALL
jgi:hypothetical protein